MLDAGGPLAHVGSGCAGHALPCPTQGGSDGGGEAHGPWTHVGSGGTGHALPCPTQGGGAGGGEAHDDCGGAAAAQPGPFLPCWVIWARNSVINCFTLSAGMSLNIRNISCSSMAATCALLTEPMQPSGMLSTPLHNFTVKRA